MERTYTVEISESPQDKILIVTHVAGIYLQLIVIVSGCIETFHNLVQPRYNRSEFTAEFLVVLLQTNIAQHHDPVSDLDRINDCHIASDVTVPLKSLLPFEDR